MQIKELPATNLFYYLGVELTEEFMGKLVFGVAALTLSASAASAQVYVSPGYGYGYGYAGLYDYAAPAYGYAAPAYAASAPSTTVVIVTPAPAYTALPLVSPPLYAYAPGYWGGYGWGGYGRWRTGYWWR
jgi:hypothetical protein